MSGRCGDVAASLQAWVNFRILYPWEDKEASGKKFPPPSKCNLQKSLPCCCLCKLSFPFLSLPFFHGTLSLSLSLFPSIAPDCSFEEKSGLPHFPLPFLIYFSGFIYGEAPPTPEEEASGAPSPVSLIYFSVVEVSKVFFSFLPFLHARPVTQPPFVVFLKLNRKRGSGSERGISFEFFSVFLPACIEKKVSKGTSSQWASGGGEKGESRGKGPHPSCYFFATESEPLKYWIMPPRGRPKEYFLLPLPPN